MDPEATYEELTGALQAYAINPGDDTAVQFIVDSIRDLDTWLKGGGFLPSAWKDAKDPNMERVK